MNLKTTLAKPTNYGGYRKAEDIEYIVIHYTGNDGDTAENNGLYFQKNTVEASAHYFVDGDSIVRSVPDHRNAWAVGGKKYATCALTGGGKHYGKCTNANSISIELCDEQRDGAIRPSAETLDNAIALTRSLMEQYNIPAERVIRHFDVTGKLCPAYWSGTPAKNKKWQTEFWNRLEEKDLDNKPANYAKDAVAWAVDKGIMAGNTNGDLMLNSNITRQQFVTMLWRFAKLIGKA